MKNPGLPEVTNILVYGKPNVEFTKEFNTTREDFAEGALQAVEVCSGNFYRLSRDIFICLLCTRL